MRYLRRSNYGHLILDDLLGQVDFFRFELVDPRIQYPDRWDDVPFGSGGCLIPSPVQIVATVVQIVATVEAWAKASGRLAE